MILRTASRFEVKRPPHRQQRKANIMQRLRQRVVHAMRQLRAKAVHVLEGCATHDVYPPLLQQRQLHASTSVRGQDVRGGCGWGEEIAVLRTRTAAALEGRPIVFCSHMHLFLNAPVRHHCGFNGAPAARPNALPRC